MGGREDPALMMDSANCSPVQVAGAKIIPPPPSHITACPDGSCMSAHKERTGGRQTPAAGLGCCSGCSPALRYPAGIWGVGSTSGSETPPGGPKAQQQPLRHRCSSPARLGDEWDFDTHHTVFAVGRSLVSEFRMSRMFTTLNLGRWFFRSLSKPDYMLCLLWFGLFSILSVIMSGDFFFHFHKEKESIAVNGDLFRYTSDETNPLSHETCMPGTVVI